MTPEFIRYIEGAAGSPEVFGYINDVLWMVTLHTLEEEERLKIIHTLAIVKGFIPYAARDGNKSVFIVDGIANEAISFDCLNEYTVFDSEDVRSLM